MSNLFSCVHDHAVISDHLCAVVLISFSATRCSEKVLTCHTVQVSAEVRQADCPCFSKPGCWLYVKHIKRVLMPMRNTLLCQGFSLLCWWTVMWFCFSFLQFEKHFSLDILVKQISECVRCWEQCTFGLTQYVNVNISCAHIWTQTCVLSVCRPVMISLRFICNVNCFHTHEVWKMLGWCPVSFLKCRIQQEKVHVLTVLTSGNILV